MSSPPNSTAVASWQEFFTAYEAAHQDPLNRWIHHLTHLGAAVGALLFAAGHPLSGAFLIAGSLPVNWAGHLLFEGNRPAFFVPADAWGKVQVALGGLAWTAVTLPRDVRSLLASR